MESFEEDLYVAAICTQTMPIVAQWTARGNTAKASSWYFGNTLHWATQYGDHETIATMITNESIDVMQTGRLQALGWVAEAGRVAATRFVFNFGTEHCSWEFSRKGGHVFMHTSMNGILQSHTRRLERFLTSLWRSEGCTV
jgi:hypothetical protein